MNVLFDQPQRYVLANGDDVSELVGQASSRWTLAAKDTFEVADDLASRCFVGTREILQALADGHDYYQIRRAAAATCDGHDFRQALETLRS